MRGPDPAERALAWLRRQGEWKAAREVGEALGMVPRMAERACHKLADQGRVQMRHIGRRVQYLAKS